MARWKVHDAPMVDMYRRNVKRIQGESTGSGYVLTGVTALYDDEGPL